MELSRTLVVMAIAIVTYMMFLTWQEDYGQVQTTPAITQPASPGVDSADSDIAVTATPVSDAPFVEQDDFVEDSDASIPSVEAQANEQMEITVKTDVFDLVINREGGDITSLQLLKYPNNVATPDIPFTLLEDGVARTYVVKSGLVGPNGTDSKNRAIWQSEQNHYALSDNETELNVDLTILQQGNVEIIKRYTFFKSSYQISVTHIIRNKGEQTWKGALYGQLVRDASEDPSRATSGFAPMPTFLGAAYWSSEKPYNKLTFDDMQDFQEELPSKEKNKGHVLTTEKGGWIGFLQHYFVSAWIPDSQYNHSYRTKYIQSTGQYEVFFVSSSLTSVEPGSEDIIYAELYMGPKKQEVLEAISPGLNMTVDYGWLWFVAQPIFAVLVFLQSGYISIFGNQFDMGFGIGNWGFSIIALTLLIKLLFFKLSASSYRSMAKMRKVAPEMMRIREQHKNDRQKQSMEMMKLYQKEKINPLGGCLPILVQMPVFIALYYVLLESIELRQAPFLLWINDLSVMDPYFILPLLMGASMFIQFRLNPTPPDPTQAQVMKWMPVIFTAFMLFFPAGLVLYWVTNNILSITQQWVITRAIENE